MTCREVIDFLMDYLDGSLPGHQRMAFDAHLVRCPACVAYLQNYEQTVRAGRAAFRDPEADALTGVPRELVEAILAARRKGA